MKSFELNEYQIFQMFSHDLGLVSAGPITDFNACTIGWGSLGSVWGGPNHVKPICTIYINEARYTNEFLLKYDEFSVSFFEKDYYQDLMTLGTLSGRDTNKFEKTKLTPTEKGNVVIYPEAKMTLICKKVYWDKMKRDHFIDQDIVQKYYIEEEPHHFYMGEIIEVFE